METIDSTNKNCVVSPCNNFAVSNYNINAWTQMGLQLANNSYRIVNITKKPSKRTFFRLKIYIDKEKVSSEIIDLYKESMKKNKITMDKYKSGVKVLFDAGVDLFVPYEISVPYPPLLVNKVNHHIQCSMDKIEYTKDGKEDCNPVGYYLYPRSSMATKTPLTLANSVGIIDSGYRGDIIAAVHCARQPPVIGSGCQTYNIEKSQRLVQLCPPDLSFPIEVVIVNEPDMLGSGGERGKGGFGSTGS